MSIDDSISQIERRLRLFKGVRALEPLLRELLDHHKRQWGGAVSPPLGYHRALVVSIETAISDIYGPQSKKDGS